MLWQLALRQAESGQREQALSFGQEAVQLLERLGKPQARVYAEHLERYRRGEAEDGRSGVLGQVGGQSLTATVMQGQATTASMQPRSPAGASYLMMAISAGKAMIEFVGSGLKTVNAETFRERLQQCAACRYHSGLRCRVCGCFTNLKARLPHEECPLGQWPAVAVQKSASPK